MARWPVAFPRSALLLNAAAFEHARALARFSPDGPRTRRAESLSAIEKLQVLVEGVRIPKPRNRRTPLDVGLSYERHVFAGAHGLPIEAWLVPASADHGVVVLFHGHAASKDQPPRC